MGKKKNQSLTERISALISRVGEKPEPTFAYIKGALVDCLGIAETLEDGSAVSEAEAQVTALETALEESEAARQESNAEVGKLQGELQTAKAEIKRYQAEQKKREEKEREIDPKLFQILKSLYSESECEWLKVFEIARAANIRVDEAEVYINGLEGLGLIAFHPHEPGGGGWHRTAEGNKLVVAKRWAGDDEEEERKAYKHADLPKIQHEILVMLSKEAEGINENVIIETLGESRARIVHALNALRRAGMADDGDEGDYGAGRTWDLLTKGGDYLAERDAL